MITSLISTEYMYIIDVYRVTHRYTDILDIYTYRMPVSTGLSFLCVLAEGFDVPQVVHTVVTLAPGLNSCLIRLRVPKFYMTLT